METRFGILDVPGELGEPDAARIVAEPAEDGEHAVGADDLRVGGLTPLARREKIHAEHWNTPHLRRVRSTGFAQAWPVGPGGTLLLERTEGE